MILLLLGAPLLILACVTPLLGDLGVRIHPFLALWALAHVAYLAACARVLAGRASGPRALATMFAVGLLARAILIATPPTLSEDLYRYLWDGRLVASGINPYLHAPSDPALERFRGGIFHRLNHADVPTIYPPGAQILFGAVARASATPVAWKIALLLLEVALLAALRSLLRRRGLPAERILLYYWNPLVLVESFASGHVDLAAAALLVAALALHESGRKVGAGVSLGVSILTKYTPALVLPWLARRRARVVLLVCFGVLALLTVPFAGAGPALLSGLRTYARHWEFNGALYRILRHVSSDEIRIREILAVLLATGTLGIAWRAPTATAAALATTVLFLLSSPTVFPWYAVPAAALLPLHPDRGVRAFTGLLALSYLPLAAYRTTGVWSLPSWILWVEYGGLALVWIGSAARSAARVRVDQREHAHVQKSKEVEQEKG